MSRTMREIKQDYLNYLAMASLFLSIGETKAYTDYIAHAEAIKREMNIRRYGVANVI